MARDDNAEATFSQEDHQVVYIFDPDQGGVGSERPAKKRRVARKPAKGQKTASSTSTTFIPLLNGSEKAGCVALRQKLYEESWAKVEDRIQKILRDANSATLDQVASFVQDAKAGHIEKIPSAFLITGPNIASQELLFDQLSETLQSTTQGRFVRLRSSEAGTLKSVLKKVIRSVTAKPDEDDDEDDDDEGAAEAGPTQGGQRYLDYDLEALHAFIKTQDCDHVFVAFQDSEAFDSGLLSDLISLFRSWRPRIPFTLLFGVATSVELLQARLLKSACRQVYGGQFDGVQSEAMLETVFKGAIAASDVSLRLGPTVLRWMLDRQHDQVAGIQSLVSSLKYAYMCHFYANPLSVLLSEDGVGKLQAEHVEALRNTPTFQRHVEQSIEAGTPESLDHAKSLLEDDKYVLSKVQSCEAERKAWIDERLRSILMLDAANTRQRTFSSAYVEAMSHGVSMSEDSDFVAAIRRLSMEQLETFLTRVITLLRDGEPTLQLEPVSTDLQSHLQQHLENLITLKTKADTEGITIRSKYSGHGKVMRTTVIAQKVQLSQDSAALSDSDNQLTQIVDSITEALGRRHDESSGGDLVFSEGWLYDSRSPLREVFVPRPRAVFARSLGRPHDYLGCGCCKAGQDGIQSTLPVTSILYQLYEETGSLINVADLWCAFSALMRHNKERVEEEITEEGIAEEGAEAEGEERRSLVMFYRGLAELRALGYVKGSRKKADHIAKVKWL